jgi:hypothetical protein
MDTADAVADGDLSARAPDADTRDFATLAERLNRMTDPSWSASGAPYGFIGCGSSRPRRLEATLKERR